MAFEQVLMGAFARGGDLRAALSGTFDLEQALEHIDRRVEGAADGAALLLAVPAAVGHLVAEELVEQVAVVLAKVGGNRQHAAVDARLDLAVEEGSVVP